jgi:hypothetical protein
VIIRANNVIVEPAFSDVTSKAKLCEAAATAHNHGARLGGENI